MNQGVAGRPDLLSSCQTPLSVLQLPRLSSGWQMIVYGAAAPRTGKTHVGGNRFLPAIECHHSVGRLEPQLLADQSIRDRVKTLLELDVSVAMHLPLSPHRKLWWDVWQAA